MTPIKNTRLDTFNRLASSYIGYRLFLALGLFILVMITHGQLLIDKGNPKLYIFASSFYLILCLVNFITFKFYKKFVRQQIFSYLILDLICITFFLFLSSGPSIAVILLYMVVVLASTMLLSPNKALAITLFSIIAVVYQQFFFSLFDSSRVAFIGTSGLVTLVFISTYALGQIAVKRMNFVESLALDQRQAFLQLQQINQSIIEQVDIGVMVINKDSQIITLNEATRAFLDLSYTAPIANQNLSNIQPTLLHELQKHTKEHARGIFHFYNDDKSIGLSIQYRPIISQQQQFTLLMLESLQKINQQVQQLKLASLGQLSASIAHEIRNPLAAISQANDLLAAEINPDQIVFSEMIQKQCIRINHIIEDTLNMSRQNQTTPELLTLDSWLNTFIHEDLNDVATYLSIEVPDDLTVYFDAHQLRLILINLIRNAIRHGHEHKPNSQVRIYAHQAGELVYIDIIDQGKGVPEVQQKDLFEPFHSTAINGTGLGLYLSKTFCEANHARLRYVAQTQGGCFRIECFASDNG